MIAFLGTGLLGAGFVRAFRRRDEEVQVWNRSPGKARALEEVGATAFDDPADAVRGATRVHITVSDDDAVDELLERVRPGLARDAIIIDHTTTAPAPTGERVRRWTERGIRFMHAPVFMGPSNALEGTGTMLASGDRTLYDLIAPVLDKMTGKVVYLGADPSRAAAAKLQGNLFIIAMMGGLADMFALGDAVGVPASETVAMFDWFNPGSSMPWRAGRMSSADLSQPTWTLAMARKDARLMIESAASSGTVLDVIPPVAAKMDRLIETGHGNEDWLTIGRRNA